MRQGSSVRGREILSFHCFKIFGNLLLLCAFERKKKMKSPTLIPRGFNLFFIWLVETVVHWITTSTDCVWVAGKKGKHGNSSKKGLLKYRVIGWKYWSWVILITVDVRMVSGRNISKWCELVCAWHSAGVLWLWIFHACSYVQWDKRKVETLVLKPASIQEKVSFQFLWKQTSAPNFWNGTSQFGSVLWWSLFSGNSLEQIILWAIAVFRFNYVIRANTCKSDKWDIISYRILWQTYTVHMKYMILRFN